MPVAVEWQRVLRGKDVHMIPEADAIRHEPSVKCACCPTCERCKTAGVWVVFHQKVS